MVESIRENLSRIRDMVRAALGGKMVEYIMGNGMKGNSMVLDFSKMMKMLKKEEASGMKAKESDGLKMMINEFVYYFNFII